MTANQGEQRAGFGINYDFMARLLDSAAVSLLAASGLCFGLCLWFLAELRGAFALCSLLGAALSLRAALDLLGPPPDAR